MRSRLDLRRSEASQAVAGIYTFEIAEQNKCEVLLMAKIEEHPLKFEVEQA
jgi:ATP-dependent Clp protease adapter protein ClpS